VHLLYRCTLSEISLSTTVSFCLFFTPFNFFASSSHRFHPFATLTLYSGFTNTLTTIAFANLIARRNLAWFNGFGCVDVCGRFGISFRRRAEKSGRAWEGDAPMYMRLREELSARK